MSPNVHCRLGALSRFSETQPELIITLPDHLPFRLTESHDLRERLIPLIQTL